MHVDQLQLVNFRNYVELEATFPSTGLTLITGANAQGKTNLLEAIAYGISLKSFRENSTDPLIRREQECAIVRLTGRRAEREVLVEAEIRAIGANRAFLNRNVLRKGADLRETLFVTAFSPGDLELVKGNPAQRREFLDDVASAIDRRAAYAQNEYARALKQRNSLVKQPARSEHFLSSLDVWDDRLAEHGEAINKYRESAVEALHSLVIDSYNEIADVPGERARVGLSVFSSWAKQNGGKGLFAELEAARESDISRGVTSVGPHRDDMLLTINGMPARTFASQGEQRTLALALKLGSHRRITASFGEPPILLLDDVFSELDKRRALALANCVIGEGQAFLASAVPPDELGDGIQANTHIVNVVDGTVMG